jgi:hypothetical protein
MGDSVPKHAGPISLTDTHPRTEHLQNATDHLCLAITKNGPLFGPHDATHRRGMRSIKSSRVL